MTTNKEIGEKIVQCEPLGRGFIKLVREGTELMERLYDMDIDQTKERARAYWLLYLACALNLAGYNLEVFDHAINEPELKWTINELQKQLNDLILDI